MQPQHQQSTFKGEGGGRRREGGHEHWVAGLGRLQIKVQRGQQIGLPQLAAVGSGRPTFASYPPSATLSPWCRGRSTVRGAARSGA